MLRPPKFRSFTLATAETAVAALIVMFLFSIISIDANREQEAFNRGVMLLTMGVTAGYLLMCFYLFNRDAMTAGDLRFIKYGGIAMIILAIVAFFLVASLAARRIL